MKMSRSRKRSPFRGITTAPSEKQDKRLYRRRYRRVAKQFIHVRPDSEVFPHLREYSNPWRVDKDGKRRFNPCERPEWMRK